MAGALQPRRDVPGPGVDRLGLPAVARAGPGVEQHPAAGQLRRAVGVDDRHAAGAHHDVTRCRARRRCGDRQPRRDPRPEPAVEHRDPVRRHARPSAGATTPAPRPRRSRRRRRPPRTPRGQPGPAQHLLQCAGSGSGCRPPAPGGAASSVSRSTNTAPGTCPASWSARPGGPPRRHRDVEHHRRPRAVEQRGQRRAGAINGARELRRRGGRGRSPVHPARPARRQRTEVVPIPWARRRGRL